MNKNKKMIVIISAAAALLLAGVILFVVLRKGTDDSGSSSQSKDSIVGTWLYADGTKYQFDDDMTGGMFVGDYKYAYTYTISGNELSIDYSNDEVHDSVYTFSFEDGKLKLNGGKGTAGGEFLLEKTDK